jgi:hypothetical protein
LRPAPRREPGRARPDSNWQRRDYEGEMDARAKVGWRKLESAFPAFYAVLVFALIGLENG